MTADEVSFAGRVYNTNLSSPYAWYYTNSVGGSITKSEAWWLISPYGWSGFGFRSFTFNVFGSSKPGYLDGNDVYDLYTIRPFISLSSCVTIKSGIGPPDRSYEIDYEGSTC